VKRKDVPEDLWCGGFPFERGWTVSTKSGIKGHGLPLEKRGFRGGKSAKGGRKVQQRPIQNFVEKASQKSKDESFEGNWWGERLLNI